LSVVLSTAASPVRQAVFLEMPRGEKRRPAAAARAGATLAESAPALQLTSGSPKVAVAFREADLLSAVDSLYTDGLRPYSRILKKRLAEQHNIKVEAAKGFNSHALRALCESSASFRVETEDGGEWWALLTYRKPTFIDIYDDNDIYPEHLWAAADAYFRKLSQNGNYRFPGGRYASARDMAARQLPFLENFSLGQVCHFMQIGISKRQLLGYADGAIVPFTFSTSHVKSVCAQQKRHQAGSAVAELGSEVAPFAVADWEAARGKMKEILDFAVLRGESFVPLSNVKRLFRSLHQLELSQTALGHGRLTDLLRDSRFHDICEVRLRECGYIVVPAAPVTEAPTHPILNSASLEEKRAVDVVTGSRADDRGAAPPVRHTFINFRPCPPTPYTQAALCRSRSVPPSSTNCSTSCSSNDSNSCSRDSSLETAGRLRQLPASEQKEAECSPKKAEPETRVLFCPDEPLCLEEAGLHCAPSNQWLQATPSPSYIYRRSGLATFCSLGMIPGSSTHEHQAAARPKFCPDEPLLLEDAADVNAGNSRMEEWASPAPWPAWTPSPQYSCSRSLLAARRQPQFCPDEPLLLEDAADVNAGNSLMEEWSSPAPWPAWTPPPQYSCSRSLLAARRQPQRLQASQTLPQARETMTAPSLPEIEHQAPMVLESTSIDSAERPLYLEGLFEEQKVQSCPTRGVEETQQELPLSSYAQALAFHGSAGSRSTSAGLKSRANSEVDSCSDGDGARSTSSSSFNHRMGTCNPCAHFHSAKGCRNSSRCHFCHECPPGELKRRQKASRRVLKQLTVQAQPRQLQLQQWLQGQLL